MIIDVSDDGLQIPKAWLGTSSRVELRREGETLILTPLPTGEEPLPASKPRVSIWDLDLDPVDFDIADEATRHAPTGDPSSKGPDIFDPDNGLGANPTDLGITDAAERHDEYVYGHPHGRDS